jgi:hypothetical protein
MFNTYKKIFMLCLKSEFGVEGPSETQDTSGNGTNIDEILNGIADNNRLD